MPAMSRSALANVSTGDRPAARASTKYMETFQLVKPALGGTDIRTYPNAVGNLDIYTIGTNDEIYRLRRGSDAAAPYHDTDLNISGRQLYLYTTTNEGSDTPNIISLGGNGQLKLAVHKSAVDAYFQTETKPANATETIRQFKGVRGLTGNIYVNVMLDAPGKDYGLLANNFFKPGTNDWAGPVWAPLMGPGGKQAEVKAIAMVDNDPVQSAILAIDRNDDVLFSETSDRTSRLRVLGANKKATQLSVVTDRNDRLNIFAVEKDTGRLLLKKEKKFSTGGQKQFDDWIYVDPAQTVKLKSVYASQRFDDLLQVFGVGEDGRLWRATQAPGATPRADPVWLTLFPLGNEIPQDPDSQATIFTVGRTKSGYAEAYTVSAAGNLTRFWQSPTSLQWFDESIELFRTDNQMVSVETHALEFTVLNEYGLPQADAPISIQASYLVTLFVNGRSYRCSQVDKVGAKAGPGGKVVIYQKANALAAATLYIETPATLAGAPLVVQANLQLQEKLETLTVNEIKDAKDAAGNYLLPEKYRSDDKYARNLQEITRASMEIARQDENGSGKVNFLFASRRSAAVGARMKLNLQALEGTAWAIDFTSGFPVYEKQTLDQVAQWKSARLAAMGPEAGGFLGIDWGDVWNAIKTAATWVWEGLKGLVRIVVEVVKGIGRVLFQIGEKVFEAIIEFAQQAFDFVEGIWNWLKVKLKQLYEWLAFLFNIKDFVRTAEAARHSMLVVLDFTVYGVESMKQTILSGIDAMKKDLKTTVDAFVADLNKQGNPNYGQYSSRNEPTDAQTYVLEHNPFANAFEENYKGARETGATAVSLMMSSPKMSSSLDRLVKMLENLADNFQFGDGKAAFEEAIGFFTAIGDNPNDVINLLLSGVVKVMESVALFALDAARGVIALLMDLIKEVVEAFKDLLLAEWEIPILSQLYKLFTGKSLSIRAVDVAAYLIAVPATLIYKLVTNEAPFPDDAALKKFEDHVTVDWMKSKFGIPTTSTSAAVFTPHEDKVLATVCLSLYAGAMALRIPVDALAGGLSAAENPVPLVGLASASLRWVATWGTFPWALNPATPKPSCPAGSPGFNGTNWICQVIFGPGRGLFLLAVFHFIEGGAKAKIYTAELTLTAWGVANFGMVIANYVETPADKREPLALSRALTNIIPGQMARCLFVPDIQKPYYIPALIGGILIVVGYLGSIGCAIGEMVEIWKRPE
jgi:hypothetical protein